MKHRWPIRLVQLSPVVVLGLMVAAWFMVPVEARSVSMSGAFYKYAELEAGDAFEAPDPMVEALGAIARSAGGQGDVSGIAGGLHRAAKALSSGLRNEESRLFDSNGQVRPRGLSADDALFDEVREHEAKTGGKTLALLLPADPTPPVAMSIIADPEVLSAELRDPAITDATIEALRRGARNVPAGPLGLAVDDLNSGMGQDLDGRFVVYSSRIVGGRFYEFYLLAPPNTFGGVDLPDDITEWSELDTPDNRADLERVAERVDGAIIVIGPIDLEPVELRAASESIRRGSSELLGAFMERADYLYDLGVPHRTTSALSDALGGSEWFSFAITQTHGAAGAGHAPPALLLVGTYDDNPQLPLLWDRVGRTSWHSVQVWLAANLLTLLGALGVLFAASLIASPASFLYERKAAEEIEIERERERVQREARRRVLDRLTHLSRDVDEVAARASGRTSRDVAHVAADIEATVNALKDVLGDANARNGANDG